MTVGNVRVVAWSQLADPAHLLPGMDAIFFASSATQTFAGVAERLAFRERWLGRFLDCFPEATFVALDEDAEIVGYVVGALSDPARDPRFADIAYFAKLAHLTPAYPAHLHINLAARVRNRGIGGRLVAAFCRHAHGRGAEGVHVVTAKMSRNRAFYARNGFSVLAELGDPGREIVMLGRSFADADTA